MKPSGTWSSFPRRPSGTTRAIRPSPRGGCGSQVTGQVLHPGPAVYRPPAPSSLDPGILRTALATRSHLRRGASSPGCRNTAATDRHHQGKQLFSLMTLLAHERWQRHDGWVRRAAWSDKTLPISVEPGGRERLFACLYQVAKRFESRSVVLSVSQTRVATPPNHGQWPKSRSGPTQKRWTSAEKRNVASLEKRLKQSSLHWQGPIFNVNR